MQTGTAVSLRSSGPNGQEMVVVVDFTTQTASLLYVEPGSGNMSVREVVHYGKRGV